MQQTITDELPQEITSRIFELAIRMDQSLDSAQRRQALMLVSQSWAAIIRSTPQLWTTIDGRMNCHAIQRSLDRSGACPLDVVLRIDHVTDMEEAKNSHSPIQHVFDEIHRWESFLLMTELNEVFPLIAKAASRLRRVKIRSSLASPAWRSAQHGEPFGGHAPQLEDVSLIRITLPWHSSILRDLTRLYLRGCIPPSPVELLALLEASPRLQTLVLLHLSSTPSGIVPTAGAVVKMMDLRTLTVVTLAPALWATLAHRFHAPRCTKIRSSRDNHSLHDIASFISHQLNIIRNHAGLPMTFDMSEGDLHLRIHGSGSPIDDENTIFQWKSWEGLRILVSAIEHDPTLHPALFNRPFKLVIGTRAHRTDPLPAILQLDCDHLVLCEGIRELAGDIIRLITSPPSSTAGTSTGGAPTSLMLLPRLHTLEIRGGTGYTSSDIVRLVKNRQTQAEEGHLQQPLLRLKVHGEKRLTVEALRELEGIMGEGNVERERRNGWS